MTKVEKELKFKVLDFERLLNYLLKNGAEVLSKSKETTIRLDTPDKNLENKGIFLRVRSGSKNTITLKEKKHTDRNLRERKETEFEIEDVNKMAYILRSLGFTYARIMEKFRINFKYKGAVLSLDEMPFGFYIEIEGNEKQIESIARELGYKEEDKIVDTYWELFSRLSAQKKIHRRNITFDRNYSSSLLA